MNSQKSIRLFSFFLLFLSFLRLWESDWLGFSIFLVFSALFFFSYSVESNRIKSAEALKERKRTFLTLSAPRITSRNEGNSHIVTLIVPSLELFNEINNDRNLQN